MKKKTLTIAALILTTMGYSQTWAPNGPNTIYALNNALTTSPINVGIGINIPTAQLHTTGTVRFAGLTLNATPTDVLVRDASGNLFYRNAAALFNGQFWSLLGNTNTTPGTGAGQNFMGTTDAQRIVFATDNVERMTIFNSSGIMRIATPVAAIPPSTKAMLQVISPNRGNGSADNSEVVFMGQVADAPNDYISLQNGTIIDGRFLPGMLTYRRSTLSGGAMFIAATADASLDVAGNTNAMVRFTTRRNDFNNQATAAQAAIVNTPLYSWENFNVTYMQMMANGFLGIGTTSPSEQLHTTAGVRFAGLTQTANTNFDIVVRDPNGKLFYRNLAANPIGITNSCATVNTIPKVINANGNLGCSQIQDNGTGVGIGVAPSAGIRLDVNGQIRSTSLVVTSDQNLKTNIKNLENATVIINKLRPTTYDWIDKSKDGLNHIGFLAQEVEKVIPSIVITDDKNEKAINYIEIIPLLTKAIQEQQTQIAELTKQVEVLRTAQAGGSNQLSQDKTKAIAQLEVVLSNENVIVLGQNAPNPFSQKTIIAYNIPSTTQTAQIEFTNVDGKILNTIVIPKKGEGVITVYADSLAAGIYYYTLIIDGKQVETKQMLLIK